MRLDSLPSVTVFATVREGFEKSPCRPFLVRQAAEFRGTTFAEALSRMRISQQEVFGYDDAGACVEHLVLGNLVEQWLEDRLLVKVFDSPLHIVDLPDVMDAFAVNWIDPESTADGSFTRQVVSHKHGQSPVLTRADAYTPFHVDPPLFGGGWMYLWQGNKTWQLVSWHWIQLLFHREAPDRLLDASPDELAALDPAIECLSATAGAGDFLYFPPGWIHRVWTHDKAIGVGGYLSLEGARCEAEQVSKQLDALGKDYSE